MARKLDSPSAVLVGDFVRIKPGPRSPYSGQVGTVSEIQQATDGWLYRVHFEDGLMFSYREKEIDYVRAGDRLLA